MKEFVKIPVSTRYVSLAFIGYYRLVYGEGANAMYRKEEPKRVAARECVADQENTYTERDRRIDGLVMQLKGLPQAERDEVLSTLLAIRRIGTTYRRGLFKKQDTLSLLQKPPKISGLVRHLMALPTAECDEIISTVLVRRDIELLSSTVHPDLQKIGEGLYTTRDYVPLEGEEASLAALLGTMQSLWKSRARRATSREDNSNACQEQQRGEPGP